MKKVTHLQWFKYLANLAKVNIVRNSLECRHMIFVSFFSSATILPYKQLKIEFHISNESYNEEQETGIITLWASSFLFVMLRKIIVCFINFFLLQHLHRFSYIKLESIHGNSCKSFFILVWIFSIYL